MKYEEIRGLGALQNGTGIGEIHSLGAVCPISLLAPGPSVVALTSCQGDDAPPEGRPIDTQPSSDLNANEADMVTSLVNGVIGMVASCWTPTAIIEHAVTGARSDVMDLQGCAEVVRPPDCTDEDMARGTAMKQKPKCKRKYRIMMKGTAGHGRACCRGHLTDTRLELGELMYAA